MKFDDQHRSYPPVTAASLVTLRCAQGDTRQGMQSASIADLGRENSSSRGYDGLFADG